jgi:hypothetical protein
MKYYAQSKCRNRYTAMSTVICLVDDSQVLGFAQQIHLQVIIAGHLFLMLINENICWEN